MDDLGRREGGGFLANTPNAEEIISNMLGGGWESLNQNNPAGKHLEEARLSSDNELKKCFVRVYNSPDGRKVIEKLLDETLRRCPCIPADLNKKLPNFEQEILYQRTRAGQNGIVTWILSMISDGMKIKEPSKTKKGKQK